MKIFPESVAKKLPEGFTDLTNSMSDEELNAKILESEEQIYKIDDDLATNEKILDMKRELKEMTAPYRETKKQEQSKIMYCLYLRESRGQEIGKDKDEE